MRITARVDYATRALVDLARSVPGDGARAPARTGAAIAAAQDIPATFLDDILADLRRGRLAASQRGAAGGWRLARPAEEITVADVIRAMEGPLADVRGLRPDELDYPADISALQDMWVALRANLRAVLEETSVADLRDNRLKPSVAALAASDEAWSVHWKPPAP
jgi:Rrf2 family protein